MRFPAIFVLWLLPTWTLAESVVATRTIRANSVLTADDVAINFKISNGDLKDPDDAIGKETRVALYAGWPIRLEDLAEPAIIERNQSVVLIFNSDGIEIMTSGRSLGRGAIGEEISVMNTSSRASVVGVILPDGRVRVRNVTQ